MNAMSDAFAALVKATTDDPTGHLPNCGYTFENETCGCAAWGERLHVALAKVITDARANAWGEGCLVGLLGSSAKTKSNPYRNGGDQ